MKPLEAAEDCIARVLAAVPPDSDAHVVLGHAIQHIVRARRLMVHDRAMIPDVLQVRDLTVIFGISEETARRYCRDGTFPAARIGKRFYVERIHLLETLRRRAMVPERMPREF